MNDIEDIEVVLIDEEMGFYLGIAERQAEREEYMTMKDWATHLDTLLTSTCRKRLPGNHQTAGGESEKIVRIYVRFCLQQ